MLETKTVTNGSIAVQVQRVCRLPSHLRQNCDNCDRQGVRALVELVGCTFARLVAVVAVGCRKHVATLLRQIATKLRQAGVGGGLNLDCILLTKCLQSVANSILWWHLYLRDKNRLSYPLLSDLNMVIRTGGCKRSEAEYRALYKAAGFKLTRAIETPSQTGMMIIEGKPA
jgi:hypothetical protein